MIAGSMDDRTEEGRGLKVCRGGFRPPRQLFMVPQPLKNSRFVIPKSRYGSVNSYIPRIQETDQNITTAYFLTIRVFMID
jgi:hypothetical protein